MLELNCEAEFKKEIPSFLWMVACTPLRFLSAAAVPQLKTRDVSPQLC